MHYGASCIDPDDAATCSIATNDDAVANNLPNPISIGRRTGGFDGNDASQIREILGCSPAIANNPTAVELVTDYE